MVQLSHLYMTTEKITALTIQTFVSKVMSFAFNALTMFVIAFLPRNKCLLISWLQSPSTVILESKKIKSVAASTFSPSICHEVMGLYVMILVFLMLSFKPAFSLSSFNLIKSLLSSSSLSAIRAVSSAYLRMLMFLPAILIPDCDLSSLVFLMMYSAYKLNKQGDNIQPCHIPFPIWNQSCSMQGSNRCFLTCIQVFRETGKMIWHSHLFNSFPQFAVIHTVRDFSVVNEAEICFSGIPLLSLWSGECWQFDLWFLCFF